MDDVIFVAGATGYTGREVVRLATARGLITIAHVRPDSKQLAAWRERFEGMGATVDSTPWEAGALAEAFAKWRPTVVFALLGTTRARGRAEAAEGQVSSYETVDYGLTLKLLEASAALEPKPRFVYLSSAGVPAREPRRGSYLWARFAVEQALREGDVPYTIARPSIITGPDRDDARPGERAAAVVVDGTLGLLEVLGGKRLAARYRSTTNEVLAGALLRLALDPAAAGTTVESEGLR